MISNYLEQDNCELFINSDTFANLFYILSNRSTLNTEEVLEKMQFVNEIFTLVPIEAEDVSMALGLCADAIVTNDKGFVSLDIC